jgi:hypothetical protein
MLEVVTFVTMTNTIIWATAPCGSVDIDLSFGGLYHLRLQGLEVYQTGHQQ